MKIQLPPATLVKIATLGAIVWLVLSLGEIPGYDTSAKGKLDLLAFSILGAVVILGLGLIFQWVYDYYLVKRQGRRHDD